MLYVTTRDKFDAYTAPRALNADCGPDGGAFVPFRMPHFTKEELDALRSLSFGELTAQLLNTFFSCRLTGWDIDTAIGRHPVKLINAGNKMYCAQLWRNICGNYASLEKELAARIPGRNDADHVSAWLKIAIRICVLFGVFTQLSEDEVDIAVPADDLELAISVWYCRQMGLPINTIICGCSQSSAAWELLHLGEWKADGQSAQLCSLERLIYGCLGLGEAKRFADIAAKTGLYKLLPNEAEHLRRGMFASVVSQERIETVISSVYRTNSCVLAPDAALAYGALMDFRAKTGTNRTALLLEDASPADHADIVAPAMKLTSAQLSDLLKDQ